MEHKYEVFFTYRRKNYSAIVESDILNADDQHTFLDIAYTGVKMKMNDTSFPKVDGIHPIDIVLKRNNDVVWAAESFDTKY